MKITRAFPERTAVFPDRAVSLLEALYSVAFGDYGFGGKTISVEGKGSKTYLTVESSSMGVVDTTVIVGQSRDMEMILLLSATYDALHADHEKSVRDASNAFAASGVKQTPLMLKMFGGFFYGRAKARTALAFVFGIMFYGSENEHQDSVRRSIEVSQKLSMEDMRAALELAQETGDDLSEMYLLAGELQITV